MEQVQADDTNGPQWAVCQRPSFRANYFGSLSLSHSFLFFFATKIIFSGLRNLWGSLLYSENRIRQGHNSTNCYSCVQMCAWEKDSLQSDILEVPSSACFNNHYVKRGHFYGEWFRKLPEKQTPSKSLSVHFLSLPSSSSHRWFGFWAGGWEAETSSWAPVPWAGVSAPPGSTGTQRAPSRNRRTYTGSQSFAFFK